MSISGYEALFWADGITCMLAALVFRFYLKEKVVEKKNTEEVVDSLKTLSPYKDKRYLFFLFLTLIGAIVFMQFLYTLPIFYKEEMHFNEGLIGGLLAMNGLLIAITEMPLVYTLEKKANTLRNVWIGVLMYGVAYMLLNFSIGSSFVVAIASMLMLSIGEIFNMPFTNTYAMSLSSENNRGAYMGLFSVTFSISHIIGPPLGTQTAAHFGFEALWYLMGAMAFVAAIGFIYLSNKDKRRPVNQPEVQTVPAASPQMTE